MRTITTYIADPIGEEAVEPLTIVFELPLPKPASQSSDLYFARRMYQAEADGIVAALATNIPGGLFDALLGALLSRKASLFRVPMENPTEGGER